MSFVDTPSRQSFWRRTWVWSTALIGLMLFAFVRSDRPGKPASTPSHPAAIILTKAAWKEKASGVSRLTGGQLIAETRPFVALMGEPFRTQAAQGKVIWYYICTDGRIQLVMFADPAQGAIIADINEY